MSSIFKAINKDDVLITESEVYKNQSIDSGSEGVFAINFRSGSVLNSDTLDPTVSGSYWNSIHTLFYQSGSQLRSASGEGDKFKKGCIIPFDPVKPMYLTKFYESGSVFSIPQYYFGEKIKKGSFVLKDTTNSLTTIEIRDDGNGNLYSPTAEDSRSAASALSSSDNYVGNIFYDHGIAVITETSSFSGSVNYTDTGANYKINFKSTQTMYNHEYTATIRAKDFNNTTNLTARGWRGTGSINEYQYLAANLTASGWSPYATMIALHSGDGSRLSTSHWPPRIIKEPLIVGFFPRAIKMPKDVDLIFKLRIDL